MKARSPIFKSAKAEGEFLAAYDAAMSLWPVPFEQRDVPTPYGSTHTILSGPADAPPLVLLHCALMTSAIWSPIVGDLSREHRIYAVDVMGDVGRTVPANPPTTEGEAADWLSAVFGRLGLEQASVVAWSFGGGIATNFAMRYPERVERLALLAPFKPFTKQGAGFLFGFLPFLWPSREMAGRFERKMCFRGDFGHPEHSELLYQRYRCGRILLKVVPPRTFTDLEFRLLTMPTLLLVGEQEYLYDGPASAERADRVLPNGRAELLADCNHAIVSDQTERVTAHLLDFLASAPGTTPANEGSIPE